jgi:S-formylglutathione hydrolase FrmB
VLPITGPKDLPVVYLLHGGDGNFRDWTNYSDVARFAEEGVALVMPEGDDSYYTNSATRPEDRYEDYIVHDLIAEVESRFPVARDRNHRAVVGISMGGFGAVKFALSHPDLFFFAGALSPALDVPSRPFSIKRWGQWRHHRSIFGPWNGTTQRENDPLVLARSADPARTPYLFLACGQQEGLLPSNRQFAAILERRHFRYEFHIVTGGHNWNQWNAQVPACFRALIQRLGEKK